MSDNTTSDSISDLTDWLATPAQAIALLSFRSHSVLHGVMDTVMASLPHRPSLVVFYDPAHPDVPEGTAAAVTMQCIDFAANGSPFIFLRPTAGSPDEQEKRHCIDFWKNLNFQREALGSLPAQIILCVDEAQRPYAYSYAKDLISWCAPRFNFPDLSPTHGPGLEAIPSIGKSDESSDFAAADLTWRSLHPAWSSLVADGAPVTEEQAKRFLLPLMHAALDMGMVREALKLREQTSGVEFQAERLQAAWLRLCGDLELAKGNLRGALQYHEDAFRIIQAFAARDPENTEWQRDLSISHNNLGNIAVAQGDLPAAARAYTAFNEIVKALTARDPENTEWQRDLSISHEKLGDIAVAQGDLPAAAKAYTAGLEIRLTLAARDPENTKWQRDLFICHSKLGDIALAQSDLAAAAAAYAAVLEINIAIAARDPENTGWQRDLSVSHEKLGDIAVAQGDLSTAAKAYTAGLEIRQTLAARDPVNTQWQRDLSISHNKLGAIARAQGDLPAAAKAYTAGLEIALTLAARDPENTQWQRDLAVSHNNLATIAERAGDAAEARAEYRRSHDILAALLAKGKHVSPQDMKVLAMLKEKAGIE